MTRVEHLLCILQEECGEVARRASKALRFGLAEVQPGQELSNADRIVQKLCDLIAVVEMLQLEVVGEDGQIDPDFPDGYRAAIGGKKAKVEKFLRYSDECGTLEG
jgi:hypothetical protein